MIWEKDKFRVCDPKSKFVNKVAKLRRLKFAFGECVPSGAMGWAFTNFTK